MQRRIKGGIPRATETWEQIPISMETNPKVKEEIILRNTFVNAQLIIADDDQSLAIRSFDDTEDPKR